MDIDKLPNNDLKPLNIETTLRMQKRKYMTIIAGLMIANIVLFIVLSTDKGDITHKLYIGLKTLGVGSIVLGFGLGLVTALIPHKNLHYSEKYFHASLLSILAIQIILIPAQIFSTMVP